MGKMIFQFCHNIRHKIAQDIRQRHVMTQFLKCNYLFAPTLHPKTYTHTLRSLINCSLQRDRQTFNLLRVVHTNCTHMATHKQDLSKQSRTSPALFSLRITMSAIFINRSLFVCLSRYSERQCILKDCCLDLHPFLKVRLFLLLTFTCRYLPTSFCTDRKWVRVSNCKSLASLPA